METIIGLLFILLPVVFKMIEKKLQSSGHTEKAGNADGIPDLYPDDDPEAGDELQPADAPVRQPETFVQRQPVSVSDTLPRVSDIVKAKPTVKRKRSSMLEENQKTVKKEKIDPKKLVIYSEIMNPKYRDKDLV